MELRNCAAFKKLQQTVTQESYTERKKYPDRYPPNKLTRYEIQLEWIIQRAKHYENVLGIPAWKILTAWEEKRNYWYMNYYQDSNQPLLDLDPARVRVFDDREDFEKAIENRWQFRCPACNGISSDPFECNSGEKVAGETCNWKSWGLFKTAGKGIYIYMIKKLTGMEIFMPIVWENTHEQETPQEEPPHD